MQDEGDYSHGVLHQSAAEVRNYMPGPWDLCCGKLQAWRRVIPKEDMCTSGDIAREVALAKPRGPGSFHHKPDME